MENPVFFIWSISFVSRISIISSSFFPVTCFFVLSLTCYVFVAGELLPRPAHPLFSLSDICVFCSSYFPSLLVVASFVSVLSYYIKSLPLSYSFFLTPMFFFLLYASLIFFYDPYDMCSFLVSFIFQSSAFIHFISSYFIFLISHFSYPFRLFV